MAKSKTCLRCGANLDFGDAPVITKLIKVIMATTKNIIGLIPNGILIR